MQFAESGTTKRCASLLAVDRNGPFMAASKSSALRGPFSEERTKLGSTLDGAVMTVPATARKKAKETSPCIIWLFSYAGERLKDGVNDKGEVGFYTSKALRNGMDVTDLSVTPLQDVWLLHSS